MINWLTQYYLKYRLLFYPIQLIPCMSEFCIECGQLLRLRQQGLQCEPCGGWILRICGTGISQQAYREAVRKIVGTVKTKGTHFSTGPVA